MDEYEKQAADFIGKTGIKIEKVYAGHGRHFEDDDQVRAIFEITVSRGGNSFSFAFGQSIMDSYQIKSDLSAVCKNGRPRPLQQSDLSLKGFTEATRSGDGLMQPGVQLLPAKTPPSDYSILSCLSSESNCPGTFEDDFCQNYGYDPDSRKAEKVYFACQKQFKKIIGLFTEKELEDLQEIS